jgi:uncharacterized membrane protein
MSRLSIWPVALILAAAAAAQVHEHSAPAHAPAHEAAPAAGVAALSPELRALFRQEMAGLQGAMLELVPAAVAADWEGVGRVASRIEGGFVLAQQLTEAQREELHARLPEGFLTLDGEFHGLARGLAAAAHERRPELVSFYVYKLTDSCLACHSRYAQERFPAFAPAAPQPAHVH